MDELEVELIEVLCKIMVQKKAGWCKIQLALWSVIEADFDMKQLKKSYRTPSTENL